MYYAISVVCNIIIKESSSYLVSCTYVCGQFAKRDPVSLPHENLQLNVCSPCYLDPTLTLSLTHIHVMLLSFSLSFPPSLSLSLSLSLSFPPLSLSLSLSLFLFSGIPSLSSGDDLAKIGAESK